MTERRRWARVSCRLAFVAAFPVFVQSLGVAKGSEDKPQLRELQSCATTLLTDLVYPTSLIFLPDGRALVAERAGRLFSVNVGSGDKSRIDGIPVSSGLLKVSAHPKFKTNRLVYLSYALRKDGAVVFEVARAYLDGSSLVNMTTLFTTRPSERMALHGGALLFLPDQTLLVSIGSIIAADDQVLESHYGTVVRLRDDGTLPEDNPFIDIPGHLPEVFSYGHRNIQGLALDLSGAVWATEHGPRGGDELNQLFMGGNYGWPLASAGTSYDGNAFAHHRHLENVTEPVVTWNETIAPSGVVVYRGTRFPEWEGDILIASLAQRRLNRVRIKAGTLEEEEILLASLGERIRDVALDGVGNIYVLTDNIRGRMIRVSPCD
jgi:glucose/arabinose dehydrogenase